MRKTFIMGAAAFCLLASAPLSVKGETVKNSQQTVLLEMRELSPLCKAILEGDLQAVESMITHGIDVNQKSLGMTPAIYAARYNKAKILKVLIHNGADLSVKCDKGRDIRRHAEISGAHEVLAVLDQAMK